MKKTILLPTFILLAATCSSIAGNINKVLWEKKFDEALKIIKEDSEVVHFVDKNGLSPLHVASAKGKLEIVKALIAQGANIQHLDHGNRTALIKAVWNNHPDVVHYLLQQGVDVNQGDKWNISPLHHAAYRNKNKIAKILIKLGADVNAVSDWKQTPLMISVSQKNPELASLLLEHDADISVKNDNNETALLLAAQRGMGDIVSQLLEKRANPNVCDKRYGRNAVHYAAISGYHNLMKSLLPKMKDAEAKDLNGMTGKEYAMQYSCPKWDKKGTEVANAKDLNGAEVFYTGHSGWVLKTKNNVIAFDYWKPDGLPDQPSLYNGWITQADLQGKPLTVFISHDHGDHYDKKALKSLKEMTENVSFVYGFNPKAKKWAKEKSECNKTAECKKSVKSKKKKSDQKLHPEKSNILAMKPNTALEHHGMNITTIKSIDTGVGFVVNVDGINVFHAGDHACLSEQDKETYYKEIKSLVDKGISVDIAFLPVSGCPSRWKAEAVEEGFYATAKMLNAKVVFPMHGGRREYSYLKFAENAGERKCKSVIKCAENPGDHFNFASDGSVVALK